MTNPVLQAIFERRSVRSFSGRAITTAELTVLADAARFAPSARNLQTWQFTVVQNKQALAKLAGIIAQALGLEPASYRFYGADALMIASNARDNPYAVEDCACALENVFLAAHSMGIGSVWINQLRGICDEPAVRKVLGELKLPENHLVWGMAALGYPASPAAAAKERRPAVQWVL